MANMRRTGGVGSPAWGLRKEAEADTGPDLLLLTEYFRNMLLIFDGRTDREQCLLVCILFLKKLDKFISGSLKWAGWEILFNKESKRSQVEIKNIITKGFTLILMTSNLFFPNVSISNSTATGTVGIQPQNGRTECWKPQKTAQWCCHALNLKRRALNYVKNKTVCCFECWC